MEIITHLFDRLLSYVYTRRFYGPRCPEFEPLCGCCQAWELHDDCTS